MVMLMSLVKTRPKGDPWRCGAFLILFVSKSLYLTQLAALFDNFKQVNLGTSSTNVSNRCYLNGENFPAEELPLAVLLSIHEK